jgi:hypothetical protein
MHWCPHFEFVRLLTARVRGFSWTNPFQATQLGNPTGQPNWSTQLGNQLRGLYRILFRAPDFVRLISCA